MLVTVCLVSVCLWYPCRNILFLPLISIICNSSYFPLYFNKETSAVVYFLATLQDVYAFYLSPLNQKKHKAAFVAVWREGKVRNKGNAEAEKSLCCQSMVV